MLAGCSLFNVIAYPVHLKLYYLLKCFFHWWNAAAKGYFWHLDSSCLLWMMTSSWTCLSHLGLLTLSRMNANLFSNVKRFCCPAWTSSRTSPGPCNDDLSGASPQTRIHELTNPLHTVQWARGCFIAAAYSSLFPFSFIFGGTSFSWRQIPCWQCLYLWMFVQLQHWYYWCLMTRIKLLAWVPVYEQTPHNFVQISLDSAVITLLC